MLILIRFLELGLSFMVPDLVYKYEMNWFGLYLARKYIDVCEHKEISGRMSYYL
jgi:hypothetical protein